MPNSIDTARSRVRLHGGEVEVVRLSPPERPAGPTLVFLHEGLGSADLWRDFPAHVVIVNASTEEFRFPWDYRSSELIWP